MTARATRSMLSRNALVDRPRSCAQAVQHNTPFLWICNQPRVIPQAAPGLRCQRSPTRLQRMEIESARTTPLPNHHLHSTGPMSPFVVYYPGLTRRCLTGPFDIPNRSWHSFSSMRGSPLPPPTLAWKGMHLPRTINGHLCGLSAP